MCIEQFTEMDGKVHTDITYSAGFLDIISIDKTRENFHLTITPRVTLLFTVLLLKRPSVSCAKWERPLWVQKEISHLVSRDADTTHYSDLIKVNIIQTDLGTGKITDLIKFNTDNLRVVTGGATLGRTDVITRDEEKWTNSEYIFNIWIRHEWERERNQGFLQHFVFSSPRASLAPSPVTKNHRKQEV